MWWCDPCDRVITDVKRETKSKQHQQYPTYYGPNYRSVCPNPAACAQRGRGWCKHYKSKTYVWPSDRLCGRCGNVLPNETRIYFYLIDEEYW